MLVPFAVDLRKARPSAGILYYRQNRLSYIEAMRQKRERRSVMFDLLRRTCGCIDCGTREGTLEFDHRDPAEREFKISGGYAGRVARRRLFDEIAKCDVRCVVCHRRRHKEDRDR